ncbi:MAG: hypothetical protein AAB458_02365 [Patescibacteria group bacterium]
MKKVLLLIVGLALVTPLVFARAEDDATSSSVWSSVRKAKDVSAEMQKRQDLMKENIEERRAEWTEKKDAIREAAGVFIFRIKAHFGWAIEWLQNIHDRMLAQVEKIEDETDADLSIAKEHLDDAQTHINDAADALEDIIVIADEDDEATTTVKDKVAGVRAQFATVKEHIQAARESLRLAMQEIKANWPKKDSESDEDSE